MEFTSKRAAPCYVCGETIPAGVKTSWDRSPGKRGYAHPDCYASDRSNTTPDAPPDPYTTPDVPPADLEPDDVAEDEPEPDETPAPAAGRGDVARAASALARALAAQSPAAAPVDRAAVERIVAGKLAGLIGDVASKATDALKSSAESIIAEARAAAVEIVERSVLPHPISVSVNGAPSVTFEHAHSVLPRVIRRLAAGRNVYLYGPPGSGKTSIGFQASRAVDAPPYLVAVGRGITNSYLFGHSDAHGNYHDTPLTTAWRTGGTVILDEMDNIEPGPGVALNAPLANGHLFIDGTMLNRHPACRFIATGNTPGFGPSASFPGRLAMDGALRDRWIFIYVFYDEPFERRVALSHNPAAGPWVDWILKVRAWAVGNAPTLHVTPRASYDGARTLAEDPESTVETVAHETVWRGFTQSTIDAALRAHPYPSIAREAVK